jgi:peptide/nickel transport system permease protein
MSETVFDPRTKDPRTETIAARQRAVTAVLAGFGRFWQEADWLMRVALILGLTLLVIALLAPLIAPHDPNAQSLLSRLRPPLGFERAKPEYWLGTDELGRDVLSRCLHGLRLTLFVALLGALIGLFVGGLLGLLAGLAGGIFDDLIMGLVDIQIAVPFTLIALLAVALFGGDLQVLIVVLGIAYWEQYARIVRGEVLRLREMPFVEAARAAGASARRIAVRHMAPNLVSPIVVMFTLNFSHIVLLESTLSFLGLGLRPPTATLGSMVGMGRDYMPSAPWVVAAPAILILLVTFIVQLIGDRLRDHTDVRLRDR